jgi:hypothetical protein
MGKSESAYRDCTTEVLASRQQLRVGAPSLIVIERGVMGENGIAAIAEVGRYFPQRYALLKGKFGESVAEPMRMTVLDSRTPTDRCHAVIELIDPLVVAIDENVVLSMVGSRRISESILPLSFERGA